MDVLLSDINTECICRRTLRADPFVVAYKGCNQHAYHIQCAIDDLVSDISDPVKFIENSKARVAKATRNNCPACPKCQNTGSKNHIDTSSTETLNEFFLVPNHIVLKYAIGLNNMLWYDDPYKCPNSGCEMKFSRLSKILFHIISQCQHTAMRCITCGDSIRVSRILDINYVMRIHLSRECTQIPCISCGKRGLYKDIIKCNCHKIKLRQRQSPEGYQ